MRNFCIFADAVNYIEDNLCSPVTQEEIAAACCCSLSALQKVWRYCSHSSLKEYISKRRLTCSAEDILRGGSTITEIAMKYGYNSPEVFTRAFKKLWGVSPSVFASEWHSSGIYPRIIPDEDRLEGGIYMGRRVDVSELYEQLKVNPDSYVLCCDVVGLMPVNDNFGREAGDSVIREAFRRIDAAAGDSMTAFRIGGDEFALVTGMSDVEQVRAVGEGILSHNGETVESGGNVIPVSIRIGAIRLASEHLRYSDLFVRLQNAIRDTNRADEVMFL
ncbi:MAG: helix-turn-helix domain-containing protein [Oscillospiraceae bacterium]